MPIGDEQQLAQLISVFSKSWELYIQFYTYFLGFNVAGLTLVAKYLVGTRAKAPVIIAFIVQNAITAFTSLGMALYSCETAKKALLLGCRPDTTPIPSWLGQWGGFANVVASLSIGICWIMLFRIKKPIRIDD